jgi:hypothetical protein
MPYQSIFGNFVLARYGAKRLSFDERFVDLWTAGVGAYGALARHDNGSSPATLYLLVSIQGRQPMTIKVLRTMVAISGDPATQGQVLKMDTIEHEGQFWLVPEWLDSQTEEWTMPARIILLDSLRHQKSDGEQWDFVLNDPLPKAIAYGETQPEEGSEYVVVERPGIQLPKPPIIH